MKVYPVNLTNAHNCLYAHFNNTGGSFFHSDTKDTLAHISLKNLLRFSQKRNLGYRLIDMLVSKYGPDTTLDVVFKNIDQKNKEERKKGTQDVDGTSQTGEETHGGDSASGEVPDADSNEGENQNTTPSPNEDGSGETDTIGNSQDDSSDKPGKSGAQDGTSSKEMDRADEAGQDAQPSESVEGRRGGSNPGTEGEPEKALPDERTETDCVNSKKQDAMTEPSAEGNTGQLSGFGEEDFQDDPTDNQPDGDMVPDSLDEESNQDVSGGNYLSPDPSASIPFRTAKRLKRKLEDLIKSYTAGADEQSHRLNGQKLIKEIVSKRYNLNKVKRQDSVKNPVLLAIDVSFSCSVTCNYTLEVAIAIAKEMPDVCQLLIHSNGYTSESQVWYDELDLKGLVTCKDWFAEKWAACFAWGDLDAEDELTRIGHKVDTYLFDDYCVSYGEIRKTKKNSFIRFTGVRGADGTISALSMLKNKLK